MSGEAKNIGSAAKRKKNALELCIFAMLGTLMFCGYFALQTVHGVEAVSMLTIVYTLVYRTKALVPIYIYVFLNGLVYGFTTWWIPYLYIWAVLWGGVMLIPRQFNENKNIHPTVKALLYAAISGLFGLLYGTLYAPFQALMFGLDFKQTIAWIYSGLLFDISHCIGNIAMAVLIVPLYKALRRLKEQTENF